MATCIATSGSTIRALKFSPMRGAISEIDTQRVARRPKTRLKVQVSLELEVVEEDEDFMADWIDRLKKQEEEQDTHARAQLAVRLHDATIIKANAPALWQAIAEYVGA